MAERPKQYASFVSETPFFAVPSEPENFCKMWLDYAVLCEALSFSQSSFEPQIKEGLGHQPFWHPVLQALCLLHKPWQCLCGILNSGNSLCFFSHFCSMFHCNYFDLQLLCWNLQIYLCILLRMEYAGFLL